MKYFIVKILLLCLMFCTMNQVEAKDKLLNAPNPTTEFENMAYFPLYPTYSWEPIANTEFYQMQVIRLIGGQEVVVRDMTNTEALNRVTDYTPFTEAGDYYWQVRAIESIKKKKNKPLSQWSIKRHFKVTTPVTFAALGDSITHGGAAFIPASQLACQWETFCKHGNQFLANCDIIRA